MTAEKLLLGITLAAAAALFWSMADPDLFESLRLFFQQDAWLLDDS